MLQDSSSCSDGALTVALLSAASRWAHWLHMTSARKRHQLLFSKNQPSTPEVAMQSILHTSCRACTLLVRCQCYACCCTKRANKNQSFHEQVYHGERELHLYCFKFKAVRATALGYCKKIFTWFGKKLISPKRTTNFFQMKSKSPCHSGLEKRIMRAQDTRSWSWNKDTDGRVATETSEVMARMPFFKGGNKGERTPWNKGQKGQWESKGARQALRRPNKETVPEANGEDKAKDPHTGQKGEKGHRSHLALHHSSMRSLKWYHASLIPKGIRVGEGKQRWSLQPELTQQSNLQPRTTHLPPTAGQPTHPLLKLRWL